MAQVAKTQRQRPPAKAQTQPAEARAPERRVRPRSEVEQETMVAANRDEIPERFLGKLKCPGCHRVIEVQTRDDLETMKIHVRNRAHGSLNECVLIEPAEGTRDA